MRVISGSLRGLRLAPPSGDRVRPTLDRVKEAAFNIIQFSVPGGRFLDMFAGSGQMGIEALSRGAASAWFFEPDAAAFRLLRGNVGRLPGGLDARLYQAPYARLAQLAPKPVFDVAYIDPPFGGGLFLEALDQWQQGRGEKNGERMRSQVAQMACKHAIKGGDRLNPQEIQGFLKEMLQSQSMPTCPHGRPIVIETTRYALEKRFKRIQ